MEPMGRHPGYKASKEPLHKDTLKQHNPKTTKPSEPQGFTSSVVFPAHGLDRSHLLGTALTPPTLKTYFNKYSAPQP